MATPTRQVRFTPLRLELDGTPAVAAGYYQWRPTSAYDDGTGRVERIWAPPLVLTTAAMVQSLPVTPLDYAWGLEVYSRFPDGRNGFEETTEIVAVPAGATIIDFEDLPRVTATGPVGTVTSAVEARIQALEAAVAGGVLGGGTVIGTGPGGALIATDISDATAVSVPFIQASTAVAARTVIGAAPVASPVFTTALTAANPTFTGTVTIPDNALALADTSGLVAALAAKAALDSPTFTGTVVVPTAVGSTSPVTKAQLDAVQTQVGGLVTPDWVDVLNKPNIAILNTANQLELINLPVFAVVRIGNGGVTVPIRPAYPGPVDFWCSSEPPRTGSTAGGTAAAAPGDGWLRTG